MNFHCRLRWPFIFSMLVIILLYSCIECDKEKQWSLMWFLQSEGVKTCKSCERVQCSMMVGVRGKCICQWKHTKEADKCYRCHSEWPGSVTCIEVKEQKCEYVLNNQIMSTTKLHLKWTSFAERCGAVTIQSHKETLCFDGAQSIVE